jgi:hypothetical protein
MRTSLVLIIYAGGGEMVMRYVPGPCSPSRSAHSRQPLVRTFWAKARSSLIARGARFLLPLETGHIWQSENETKRREKMHQKTGATVCPLHTHTFQRRLWRWTV